MVKSSFVAVIDTEAAPIVRTSNVEPRNMRVYDAGWVILDTNDGSIVERRDYAVSETFCNARLMQNAYYSDKLPWYWEAMRNGSIGIAPLADVRNIFCEDVRKYEIDKVWAYNCRFDYTCLNATIDAVSNGYRKVFLPYGVKMYDVWELFGRTFAATKRYVKFCRERGYLSASGNPQTSAEIAYRYLTEDVDFVERHTALSDAEIEAYILTRCLTRKPNVSKANKWGNGWREAAKIAKQMQD